jgi:hypothetical protein
LSAAAESSFVIVRGHQLEYRRYAGRVPAAPTIVMLHEGLGSVSMWRDFPRRVSDVTGCPVVV